jgi:DNA-binding CsgD family transcriptional regulator
MTDVLLPNQVADLLQVSEFTVRKLIRSGHLERLP